MYVSSYANEPLLGPSTMRKRVQGPVAALLHPRIQRVVQVVSWVCVMMFMAVFMLGLYMPATVASSTSLLASDNSTVQSSRTLNVIAPVVVYSVATAMGLSLGIVGYRFIRLAFLCAGFVIGLVLGFNAGYLIFQDKSYVFSASLGLGAVGGIVLGSISLYLHRCGLVFLGILSGIGFGAFIGAIFLMRLYPAHPEVPILASMGGFGILLGLVTFLSERPVVILCTSFLGGYFFVLGFGNLFGNYPSPTSIVTFLDKLRNGQQYEMPTIWWAYFGATIVAWILFTIVQFQYTAPYQESTQVERRPPRPPIENDDDYTAVTSPKGSGPPKRGSFHVERGL
ncbi:hypothetical protein THRCLA_22142 [Thraustotheca clavata]|uniref:Transmembrane protein 198 n=1 Tax=Thraustotheca clavata TaxID=74557 RepID=A0A1V9ZBN6_9STRA|nr:hypothetical protein THRCLA_22142 [Thraustotheca clavata]